MVEEFAGAVVCEGGVSEQQWLMLSREMGTFASSLVQIRGIDLLRQGTGGYLPSAATASTS